MTRYLKLVLLFVCGAATVVIAQTVTGANIPVVIQGLAGPIRVVMRDSLIQQGLAGQWTAVNRTIEIQRGDAIFERQTLWHELAHAALWDAGYQIGGPSEERLADIFGAAASTSGCVLR